MDRAAGLGVVEDRAFDDGAVGDFGVEVAVLVKRGLHVFPAEAACLGSAIWQANSAVGIALAGLAWQADADQAFAGGEDDTTIGVVPSVSLVLAHDRELYAVDGQQLIQGQAEGLSGEYVDFHQCLTAGVIAAQSAVALPFGGELSKEILRQAEIVAGPAVLLERRLPTITPEVGVTVGQAVEH